MADLRTASKSVCRRPGQPETRGAGESGKPSTARYAQSTTRGLSQRQARQQVDVPHCADRLFCAHAVPIIAILLTGRRAAFSSVHPTDATAANRRGTATLPGSFRLCLAARRVVGALHGVDGHFDLVPPPTPTGSGTLASSRIGIGITELAARRAGDATLLRAPNLKAGNGRGHIRDAGASAKLRCRRSSMQCRWRRRK
jgi:hypothetical protein